MISAIMASTIAPRQAAKNAFTTIPVLPHKPSSRIRLNLKQAVRCHYGIPATRIEVFVHCAEFTKRRRRVRFRFLKVGLCWKKRKKIKI
jgi:hypothetical protein